MREAVIDIEPDGALGDLQRQTAVRILWLKPVGPAHPMGPC
jgi:hypothetical protein